MIAIGNNSFYQEKIRMCRERAELCRAEAANAAGIYDKEAWSNLAGDWDTIADRFEEKRTSPRYFIECFSIGILSLNLFAAPQTNECRGLAMSGFSTRPSSIVVLGVPFASGSPSPRKIDGRI
jgi:hypothetical protein